MRQVYILVVDRHSPTALDDKLFCSALDSDTHIQDWWHQIPTGFILISSYLPNNLATKMKILLPGRSHLILKADLQNAAGLLPKEAWEWINNRVFTTKHMY